MSDHGDDIEVVASRERSQVRFQADSYTTSDGGHLIRTSRAFVGTAGMVGYKIEGEQTLYLRLLAENPEFSSKNNYITAAILTENEGIDKSHYNWLYAQPAEEHNSASCEGKTLKALKLCRLARDLLIS
ncbi:hypothetical protein APSETT445_006010 [Aspergillus pseudonomiae]